MNRSSINDQINAYGIMDISVLQAVVSYIQHGLDPGSFGRALIANDYPAMLNRKHSLLQADHLDNMLRFTQSAPAIALKRGWKGFFNETSERQFAFRLQADEVWNFLTDDKLRNTYKTGIIG